MGVHKKIKHIIFFVFRSIIKKIVESFKYGFKNVYLFSLIIYLQFDGLKRESVNCDDRNSNDNDNNNAQEMIYNYSCNSSLLGYR